MSKRYIFPQQYGERKKPKLDFSISDHNFPLSQNAGPSKDINQADTWGDDNDDEILLLASQACEDAYTSGNDTSHLPDYSLCMQPSSTSTQISINPQPSTSKTSFSFKKPTSCSNNVVSTSLNDKCHRISTPLPGITTAVMQNINGHVNLTDDLIFNDKIYKAQDSEHMYRQMLQLQEENAKLKSENGKLLEKCVTKEGEASILRTQLKTCQVAVDNARLEKLKAQERVQIDWTEKLTAANKQMQDLRTQLDFKNLEIISTKEKCKMLESTKVKLTQVTVAGNDISFSHRNNSIQPDTQSRRVKSSSTSSVQTDNQTYFLKLNKAFRSVPSKLKEILPLILQASTEQQNSILDYSETLQKPAEFSQNRCRIFSTFHRIPNSPVSKGISETKLSIACVFEDLTHIATALDKGIEDGVQRRYFNLFTNINKSLKEVETQLETISQRMTSSFQKEMDERYVDASNTYLGMSRDDLLSGKSLYKEEQGILARRMAAIAARTVEATNNELVGKLLEFEEAGTSRSDEGSRADILEVICRICYLLDSTSCTVIYSGLLLSITFLLETLWEKTDKPTFHKKLLDIARTIITSRPMAVVSTQMLSVLRKLASFASILGGLCAGNTSGNLKLDYDQGVLLYRKESCYLQVFLKQIEAALKCIERQCLVEDALNATQQLMAFYCNISTEMSILDKRRCDCNLVMSQVMVYALQICAVMLNNLSPSKSHLKRPLESVCRSGLLITYQWVVRDVECASQLGHYEGYFHVFVETCDIIKDALAGCDVHGNILSELMGTLQPSTEDVDLPSNLHKQVWMDSFSRFSIVD